MNRSSKVFQVIEGIFLIAALVFLAFPFYIVQQENYPDRIKRSYEILLHMKEYSMQQMIYLLVIFLFPMLLSLVLGMILMLQRKNHWVFVLGNLVALALYTVLYFLSDHFMPKAENAAQSVNSGIALYIPIVCSGLALAAGIVSLVLHSPERQMVPSAVSLEGLDEIRQKQHSPGQFMDEAEQMPQRNKTSPAPSVIPPARTRQLEGGVMIGLQGIFAGAEIPLKDGEMIRMGRDTSNHLVFQDQEKVSRNHCVIMWLADQKKYQIKDISSNGCFINGNEEEPIPQNIPIYLEPGTVLDIGDSSNRFQLG